MQINHDALLRALLKIQVLLKVETMENMRLSKEVAALRNTLQELSGDRFLPIVERHRKELQEKSAPIEVSLLQDVDSLIPLIRQALPDASV